MKRKLSLILAALVLLAALAACGGNSGSSGSDSGGGNAGSTGDAGGSGAGSDGTTTLVIAARGGTHVDVIEAVKAQFEAEHDCVIEVLGLEADDLKQKVALDSRNAVGAYDLCMIDDPVMPELCEAEVLLNLTENGYEADGDFVKASLDIGRYPYATGDIYALPFAGNVTLLFYNQSVLDSVGESVPETLEDLLATARKVNAEGKLGYVIRGQQGNPIVGDYLPILWAHGGDIFDDSWNVLVDSQEAKDALNFYIELLGSGANYEKDDIVAAVSEGNAAMSLGWPSWYIVNGEAAAGYARMPGKVNASSGEYPSGVIGNWMMAVTANSANKDLAQELLVYLTSAETQKAAASAGAVPTRTSVFEDSALSAEYPFYGTLLDATENSRVRPRTDLWSEIENVYGIELSNAISGVKDVDAALADARTAIEKVMQ